MSSISSPPRRRVAKHKGLARALLFLVLTPLVLFGCGDSGNEDFVLTGGTNSAEATPNTIIELTGVAPRVLARNAQVPDDTVFIKVTQCRPDGTVEPLDSARLIFLIPSGGADSLTLDKGEGRITTEIRNSQTIGLRFSRTVGVSLIKITYLDGNNLPVGRAAARVATDGSDEVVKNPPLIGRPGEIVTCEVVPSELELSIDPGSNTQQIRVNAVFGPPSTTDPRDIAALAQFATTNATVATVSEDGLITARAQGQATINVFVNGQTKTVQVTVGTPQCTVNDRVAGPRTQVIGSGFRFQHTLDCDEAFTFGTFRVTNNSDDRTVSLTVGHTGAAGSLQVANDDDLNFDSTATATLTPNSSAVFRVRYTNSETQSFQADVTAECDDGVGPPLILRVPVDAQILPLFTAGQQAIVHTHVFGVSNCPDPIGSFPFTNNCSQSVMVDLEFGRIFSPSAPLTVNPGATVQVPISFDCGTDQSFSEVVGLRVTGPNGVSTGDGPPVTVNIVDP